MNQKITFVKNYTRDTTLIIQEMWFKKLREVAGDDHKKFPVIGIDHINDGAIEIWENEEAVDFIIDKLVKESFENNEELSKKLLNFEREIEDLKLLWSNKTYFDSKEDLLDFIDRVDRWMFEDIVILYLGANEKAERSIQKKSEKLRLVDTFFASNDLLIRRSLEHLFPEFSPFTTYIRKEEILGIINIENLKERYNNFFVDSDRNIFNLTLENFLKQHGNYFFKESKNGIIGNEVFLSGQIGNRGTAVGRVMIFRRINQIKDVPEGAVIVSPMTTPALVPGLKRAVAIVTDEGGMLCHAAVIARELNIPCVIGTKSATTIFKDCDLVEVDADKGVVKKINFN